jgi:transcription termination/antitermination protein NusG
MAGFAQFDAAERSGVPAELYGEPRWYACYTRSRAEKRVASQLERRGLECFLPTYPRKRRWKDREKLVDWPLFPGYVFGRFPLCVMHRVLATPGLTTIVRANGYPTPIPEAELANVREFAQRLATSGLEPKPSPMLKVGQRVRIYGGPLEGVEAVVLKVRGRRRVLVGLQSIGHGLEVDVDRDLLKPLAGPGVRRRKATL